MPQTTTRSGRSGRVFAIRPGRPVIRNVYHLAAEIDLGGRTVDDAMDYARRIAVGWISDKYPERLPNDAKEGGSVRCEMPGQTFETVAIPDRGIWCARLEQPDVSFDRDAVAGRTWQTDLSLCADDRRLLFGVKVGCASLPDCTEGYSYTRPFVVPQIGTKLGLRTIRPLEFRPNEVHGEEGVDDLVDLLVDPARELPVVVLTEVDTAKHGSHLSRWLLDPKDIGKRLYGLAHVFLLPSPESYELTKAVGRRWTVFDGSVRTYLPGVDLENGSPFGHPRASVETVMGSFLTQVRNGEDVEYRSEAAFARILQGSVGEIAASRRVDWGGRLFVPEARGIAAAAERDRIVASIVDAGKAADESDELRGRITAMSEAHERQLESLREELTEAQQEAERWSDESIRAGEDLAATKKESADLRNQVLALRAHLEDRDGSPIDAAIEIPDDYESMEEWAGRHLAGRLVLMNRALRALNGAEFEDPPRVYRALLLLANEYRDMKIGTGEDPKATFEQACEEQHLNLSGSISENQAGAYGDTYYARWPLGSERRVFIDLHLRSNGNSRDPKRCLAIYFFWDDANSQVVVASLPGHLQNRMT